MSAKRGATVNLRYRVSDALSPTARVTIVVRNSTGGTVRTLSLGARMTGVDHAATMAAPSRAGRYRYVVMAMDLAGNAQSVAGSNALTVH